MDATIGSISSAANVALVTQTRVLPGHTGEIARWQQHVSEVIARFPGFIEQENIPPAPPVQIDWVTIQHFDGVETARAWLQSREREELLNEIQPLLVGPVDVHLFSAGPGQATPTSVSMLVSTRVKAGQEAAFLHWQKRIAAVQASFEGFQGYKLEPPIPGMQDTWAMVIRFDSDAHLDAWLNSEQRRQLLAEAAAFDEGTRVRKVRSGFETWFVTRDGDAEAPPPAWKQNALVLLMLFPVIFLFDYLMQLPLERRGMPFWLSLFIADAVGVPLLGVWLTPQVSKLFKWWLGPAKQVTWAANGAGAAVILLLYGASVFIFARFP